MISLINILNEVKPLRNDNSIWVYLLDDGVTDYLEIIKGNQIIKDENWDDREEEFQNDDDEEDDTYGLSKLIYKNGQGVETVGYYKHKIKVK